MFIDRLSINVPLHEPTILKLLLAYRSAIVRNLLGLLEGRLVYYEPIPIVTKHICRIIVPASFCHIIFNLSMQYLLLNTWGNTQTCIGFYFNFCGLDYVLMFLN